VKIAVADIAKVGRQSVTARAVAGGRRRRLQQADPPTVDGGVDYTVSYAVSAASAQQEDRIRVNLDKASLDDFAGAIDGAASELEVDEIAQVRPGTVHHGERNEGPRLRDPRFDGWISLLIPCLYEADQQLVVVLGEKMQRRGLES
jgi:hypothetical protein